MSVVVYDEFIFFRKLPCQVQGRAVAWTHQLMQEVHETDQQSCVSPAKKIKKRMRVRVSIQSQLPHAHHFVTHTHFSMTLLRFSAKLRLCLPVEVWWEKSHWGREERSLVLWDTCTHTHTHTPHSRQGVDRSDIWSCLTGREKKQKEKRRGKEKKGREEREEPARVPCLLPSPFKWIWGDYGGVFSMFSSAFVAV